MLAGDDKWGEGEGVIFLARSAEEERRAPLRTILSILLGAR